MRQLSGIGQEPEVSSVRVARRPRPVTITRAVPS